MSMRSRILFDEENHVYSLSDDPFVKLSGITGRIGQRLGKNFPKKSSSNGGQIPVHIENAALFGSGIHKEVERALMEGVPPEHALAKSIVKELSRRYNLFKDIFLGEVLVSDYKQWATAIDIVVLKGQEEGKLVADVFDIKTGNFDREYCSWQLGIGAFLLEMDGDIKVDKHYVLSTKDREVYTINPKSIQRIRNLLYGE